MSRPKGTPKTGGRQKGTLNKRNQELTELIQSKFPDYNPVLAMAEIANNEDVSPEMRFQAHKEVAQYFECKRRAIEMTVDLDESVMIPIVNVS